MLHPKRFHTDSRPVTKDLGSRDIRTEIGSIVSYPHDSIGAEFDSMSDHGVIGMLATLLAHLGVGPDATADDAFETSKDSLGNGRRAHNDTANHPLMGGDPVSGNIKGGRSEHG